MSYRFEAPESGAGGDVDFDFFDEPEERKSPTNLGGSGKWKTDPVSEKTAGQAQDDKNRSLGDGKNRQTQKTVGHSDEHDERDSDSYSSDYTDEDSYSDDRNSNREVKKIEAKIPTAGMEPNKSTRNDSDSEHDGQHSDTRKTGKPTKKAQTQSKKGTHRQKERRSRSYSSDSGHSNSSLTDSDLTDSDVTDVSPLNSPRSNVRSKPPKSPNHKEVTFRQPLSAKSSSRSSRTPLVRADSDDIDLKLLMQAILEMEKGQEEYSPPKATRQMFQVAPSPTSASRRNYSFSNDSVSTIDRENNRLMQQIMKQAQIAKQQKKTVRKTKKRPGPVDVSSNKMATSAINRTRKQQQIEQENFAMLQRLQKARPAKQLSRDSLLDDYNHQILFGCSVSDAHPPQEKSHKPVKISPYSVPFDPSFNSLRSGSMSSLKHGGDSESSSKRARPFSAKEHSTRSVSAASRPVSATTHVTRPVSATSASKKRPQSAKIQSTNYSNPIGYPVNAGDRRAAWDERW